MPALAMAITQAGLFLVVYNGCLGHTAGRADIGRLYSTWELHTPLVPAMIVPYLSIYPLFFVTFFLCGNSQKLRTLCLQLMLAQAAAGACYLAFPLECGFHRPAITGMFGPLFRIVDATDLPYNLAPSLHVTMAVILGRFVTSGLRGLLAAASITWFALIAISTMLTWQHHLVDVVAGAVLGLACTRLSTQALSLVADPLRRFIPLCPSGAKSCDRVLDN